MKEVEDVSFIRLDILENWRFWIKYTREHGFEEAGKEVLAQANALLAQDYGNERVAKLLTETNDFKEKKRLAGKKGGEAKRNNAKKTEEAAKQPPPKPRTQTKEPHQPTKDELYLFADTENLDVADAREWYEINYVDRPGCDKNGEVIKNWKGHCKRYCQAKLNKRNQENENAN